MLPVVVAVVTNQADDMPVALVVPKAELAVAVGALAALVAENHGVMIVEVQADGSTVVVPAERVAVLAPTVRSATAADSDPGQHVLAVPQQQFVESFGLSRP